MANLRGRQRYYRYLESPHWKNLRKQAFERDGYKCIHCGSPHKLRGHHKHYRKNIEDCEVGDIETLCNSCHEEHHRQKAKARKANRKP